MITYQSGGAFGLQILFRVHGSAVFKSCTPALLSSVVYIALHLIFENNGVNPADLMDHPYPMGALIAAFSFLLIFRANFSYNRYWEAHTAIHTMHSKWLDVATELAAFHLQSQCYEAAAPPSFGKHELYWTTDETDDNTTLLSPLPLKFSNSNATTNSHGGSTTTPHHHQKHKRQQSHALTTQQLQETIDAQLEKDEQAHLSLRSRFLSPTSKHSSKRTISTRGSNRFRFFLGKEKGTRHLEKQQQEPTTATRIIPDVLDASSRTRDGDDAGPHDTFVASPPASPQFASAAAATSSPLAATTTAKHPHFSPSIRTSARNPYPHRHRSAHAAVELDKRTIDFRSTPLLSQQLHQVNEPLQHNSIRKSKAVKTSQRYASDFYHPADNKHYSSFWRFARKRLKEGHMDPAQVPVPYFLESVVHLLSLMSAVALSTLRNDLEEAESPLAEFRPGAPWPHVDPDMYQGDIRKGWYASEHRSYTIVRYLLGLSRTDNFRKRYNLARPFRVIGSVSDEEIQALQAARGNQAKVTLVAFWLQELISREYMAGSTGKIAPPIISRVYQFISDGMAGFNQARKVAYIPFPFPHAQITTLFVLVIVGFIPVLMLTYLDNEIFGFFWNWLTVMCFTGLHEVARELENPFQNVPNDIPLNHFQAQYNEGLMVMFFGYHPDAYWLVSPPPETTTNGGGSNMGNQQQQQQQQQQGTGAPDNSDNMSPTRLSTNNEEDFLLYEAQSTEEIPSTINTAAGPSSVTSKLSTRMDRYEAPLQMSPLHDDMLVRDYTKTFDQVATDAQEDNGDDSRNGSDGSAIFAPEPQATTDEEEEVEPFRRFLADLMRQDAKASSDEGNYTSESTTNSAAF